MGPARKRQLGLSPGLGMLQPDRDSDMPPFYPCCVRSTTIYITS